MVREDVKTDVGIVCVLLQKSEPHADRIELGPRPPSLTFHWSLREKETFVCPT